MQIRLIKPGLLSTVQDGGRTQYRAQAVPLSGAMDTLSARMANIALGNPPGAAVLEFTYAGASFQVETEGLLACSGDGATWQSGGRPLPQDRPVFLPAGAIVELMPGPPGCRTYLATAGGWDVPLVLGSRSTYLPAGLGGLQGRALQSGDVLGSGIAPAGALRLLSGLKQGGKSYLAWALSRHMFLPANRRLIRVVPGREFTSFSSEALISLLTRPFTLSRDSDRMGCRLQGEKLERRLATELLSTAVAPGTLQVTHEGSLILLMADAQTTGGYPRIGQVAAVDLPLCAQLKPGDAIYFTEISRHEAERLYIKQEELLQQLAATVHTRLNS